MRPFVLAAVVSSVVVTMVFVARAQNAPAPAA